MTDFQTKCKKTNYGGYRLSVSHNGVHWQSIYFRDTEEMQVVIKCLERANKNINKNVDKTDTI